MTEYEANFEFKKNTMEMQCQLVKNQLQADLVIHSGDKHYTHEQAVVSDTWIVTHNLNKKPSIEVVDSADNVVTGDYEYNDLNTVTLRFNGAFSGKAYFN